MIPRAQAAWEPYLPGGPSQLALPSPSSLLTWQFLQPPLVGKGHVILVGTEPCGHNAISPHLVGGCGLELAGHLIRAPVGAGLSGQCPPEYQVGGHVGGMVQAAGHASGLGTGRGHQQDFSGPKAGQLVLSPL